jgi:hypothetical protein
VIWVLFIEWRLSPLINPSGRSKGRSISSG